MRPVPRALAARLRDLQRHGAELVRHPVLRLRSRNSRPGCAEHLRLRHQQVNASLYSTRTPFWGTSQTKMNTRERGCERERLGTFELDGQVSFLPLSTHTRCFTPSVIRKQSERVRNIIRSGEAPSLSGEGQWPAAPPRLAASPPGCGFAATV